MEKFQPSETAKSWLYLTVKFIRKDGTQKYKNFAYKTK